MDVFSLRNEVIEDYQRYVQSFLRMSDPRVAAFVTSRLNAGALWPEPLVQLSPAYQEGPTVEELVTTVIGVRP